MKYVLKANDMRSSNIENTQPVAVSDDKQRLIDYIKDQLHGIKPDGEFGSWKDGQWGKVFKAGSPLEWFNIPFGIPRNTNEWTLEAFNPDSMGQGIMEVDEKAEYVSAQAMKAEADWDEFIGKIPNLI